MSSSSSASNIIDLTEDNDDITIQNVGIKRNINSIEDNDTSVTSVSQQIEAMRKKKAMEYNATHTITSSSPSTTKRNTWQPFYLFASKSFDVHVHEPNCIRMSDIFYEEPDSSNPIIEIFIFNFLIDLPALSTWLDKFIANSAVHVHVFHGESSHGSAMPLSYPESQRDRFEQLYYNWSFTKIQITQQWGSHHSKVFVIFYSKGVRLVIHTANLRENDVYGMTQGCWIQDFPPKAQDLDGVCSEESEFESDLCFYFSHLSPESPKDDNGRANLAALLAKLKKYDFSAAEVILIPSVPGRHSSQLCRLGHTKLRSMLRTHVGPSPHSSVIGMQVSSLSSLGPNQTFLKELAVSMRATINCTLPAINKTAHLTDVEIVWATLQQVGRSVMGYVSGGSMPCQSSTIRESGNGAVPGPVKEGVRICMRKWQGVRGKVFHSPHIKTFYRYYIVDGQPELMWLFLGSHNLSQAAWGKLEKNDSQLFIKSYELGVLFLPAKIRTCRRIFSCSPSNSLLGTDHTISTSATTSGTVTTPPRFIVSADQSSSMEIAFPLPHLIPAPLYNFSDIGPDNTPWVSDMVTKVPDRLGRVLDGGM